jgi:hypothetical protein
MAPVNDFYPKIRVSITRFGSFRAKIKEGKDLPWYEVSVGGDMWEKGKGRKFEVKIKEKCYRLLNKANSEYAKFFIDSDREVS